MCGIGWHPHFERRSGSCQAPFSPGFGFYISLLLFRLRASCLLVGVDIYEVFCRQRVACLVLFLPPWKDDDVMMMQLHREDRAVVQ